jgi:hypothetical protein
MSLDHPVLDEVVLSSSTLFDVKRQPLATRLTVYPQRPDSPIDVAGVLAVAAEIAPPARRARWCWPCRRRARCASSPPGNWRPT